MIDKVKSKAKFVLMRSAPVSPPAKQFGRTDLKFISQIFIKKIQIMAKKERQTQKESI